MLYISGLHSLPSSAIFCIRVKQLTTSCHTIAVTPMFIYCLSSCFMSSCVGLQCAFLFPSGSSHHHILHALHTSSSFSPLSVLCSGSQSTVRSRSQLLARLPPISACHYSSAYSMAGSADIFTWDARTNNAGFSAGWRKALMQPACLPVFAYPDKKKARRAKTKRRLCAHPRAYMPLRCGLPF